MISAKSNRHPNTFNRVALVFLVIGTVVAAAVFSSPAVSSQDADPQRRDLERVFTRHERLTLDPGQIQKQVKQTRSLTLNTSRGTFEMTLEPHDMRAPGYVAEARGDKGVTILERAPVRTYKGTVKGLPGAQARLTIDEGTVEGLIITPEELFFLEPVKRYSGTAAKSDFVFYSESDLKESAGECGTTMAEMVAQHSANVSTQTSAKGPQPEEVFGPALEIGIALEADFEYFQLSNNAATTVAQIESIMSQVEGIYNTQIGLQFLLVHTRVWSSDIDPYTSSAPSALLNEFRSSYSASAPPQAAGRDLAHLFTGRNLDGTTIGVAYQPGLDCNSTAFAYGLSQNITGNRAGLTAHEVGHNLSASHVTSAQSCTLSIMNPSISSTTDFCQFSRDEITDHAIAMRACLTPLTQPGCTYTISPPSQNILAGGGGGSVTVNTTAGCNWAVAEGEAWLTVTSGASGTGTGTVNFSATSNSVCGPRSALMIIGGQPFTVNQAGNPNYLIDTSTATAIAPFQTLNGDLSPADCTYGVFASGRQDAYMDRYKFDGTAGQYIRIEMNAAIPPQSGGLDTYLYLLDSNGNIVAQNDDLHLGNLTNSRIPCNNNPTDVPCIVDFFTLPQTGTYIIVATSFSDNETGAYSLTLTLFSPLAQQANISAVAALNSVTFAATSNADHTAFRIVDPHNFSSDQITRLILFTPDLGLPIQQGPDPAILQVRAGGQDLVVENVGPFAFPGLNGSYVVVALKRRDLQPMVPGNLTFTVTCRGKTSTALAITIAP